LLESTPWKERNPGAPRTEAVTTLHYQTTLRDTIEFEGIGLHTGLHARVAVRPAKAGNGLSFRVNGGDAIPARAEFVTDTRRATVLGNGERSVSTVEHLLSALMGMGIDNASIDVEGTEIPVMDGSALPFAQAIADAGSAKLAEPKRRYVPAAAEFFRDGDKMLVVVPAGALRTKVMVAYEAPVGAQFFDGEITPEVYLREIAPARTFGFAHEIEALRKAGLARGGTLENAVVFAAEGPMQPLRFPDEPVRHKVLDLIGDFALLGAWPQCEVIAVKGGHALHHRAVLELRKSARLDPAVAR
jgi:UDP-3-O-[3-hydroxymyristoyl] N-acetylglucosamine deacetylase